MSGLFQARRGFGKRCALPFHTSTRQLVAWLLPGTTTLQRTNTVGFYALKQQARLGTECKPSKQHEHHLNSAQLVDFSEPSSQPVITSSYEYSLANTFEDEHRSQWEAPLGLVFTSQSIYSGVWQVPSKVFFSLQKRFEAKHEERWAERRACSFRAQWATYKTAWDLDSAAQALQEPSQSARIASTALPHLFIRHIWSR